MSKKHTNNIAIAAGGTGGHVFPAEAVANILAEHHSVTWLLDDRTYPLVRRNSSPSIELKKLWIWTFGICRIGKRCSRILSAISMATIQAIWVLWKRRCRLVVGFGGYPSLPVLTASFMLRIPLILHEQNAVLGRVNKLFLPYATSLLTSFPKTHGVKACYEHKVKCLGIPLRKSITSAASSDVTGHTVPNRIRILVTGGSQGATIFSTIVPGALVQLSLALRQQLVLWQQSSPSFHKWLQKSYDRSLIEVEVASFFDNIGELMQQASLVICRAGSSTIGELAYLKKPAIIVPLPSKDQHQQRNAELLVQAGSAIMIEQKDFTPNKLASVIEDILTTDKLQRMAKAAKSMQVPGNANIRIATEIEELLS